MNHLNNTLVLSFYLLFILLILFDGLVLTSSIKQANPNHLSPNFYMIFRLMYRSIVSVLPILIIHFWLSFRIKNLITNIGIGLIGIITGLVLASPGTWDLVIYYPYAFPSLLAYKLNPSYHYPEYPASLYSLIYFCIIGALCYLDLRRNFNG